MDQSKITKPNAAPASAGLNAPLPLPKRTALDNKAKQILTARHPRPMGTSDGTKLRKKIEDTHESNAYSFPVKHFLHTIEVICHHPIVELPGPNQASVGYSETSELKSLLDRIEPPRGISAISCEILSKCLTGVDVHTITMNILHLIKLYNWESKVVLALSSFARIFGEFRLVFTFYSTNPLAKAVAILKKLPEQPEDSEAPRQELIEEIIDVTKKIVEFYHLSRNEYITIKSPELLSAGFHTIPTAVYWTIRSIVVSTAQMLALTGMDIKYLTGPPELTQLTRELDNIKGRLVDIINSCVTFIARRKEEEEYETIARILEDTNTDNTKPLRAMFNPNDEQPALYDGYNKIMVSIDELRRKVVVLFITDLDLELIGGPDFTILQKLYTEKKVNLNKSESQYEIIWVPVVDYWTEDKDSLLESLKNQMEWYSIYHPTVVPPGVIRYIRKMWNFSKKPMVIVMDMDGKIVHTNAIHMMCIWRGFSYPFTTNREKLLWDSTNWTIDLVADSFDPNLPTWIQEERHVCLYGGEDIDWIRNFTKVAKDVAREAEIDLKLLYVGKRNPKEKFVRNIIDTIHKEGLSSTLDWNLIWYFWVRMESMWLSKGQQTSRENIKKDPIMLEIIAILSYGSSELGWAVISGGFGNMVKGNGGHMSKGLHEHGRWVNREKKIGFVSALDEYLKQFHLDAPHHCTKHSLPATGTMPEYVLCSDGGHLMEKYTPFRCCLSDKLIMKIKNSEI